MVQRLRLRASTAGGVGLIPDQGTKIPHASRCGQKEKEKSSQISYEELIEYVSLRSHLRIISLNNSYSHVSPFVYY